MTNYNLIRALAHPYVGAHSFVGSHRIKIWKSTLPQDSHQPEATEFGPGAVFRIYGGEFDVVTGAGFITVSDYELDEGGTLQIGSVLGSCV